MVLKRQKSGDQKAIMQHYSFLERPSPLAIARSQRDLTVLPATMVVQPVTMNDDESAESQVVEQIDPNIVRLNEQLQPLQLLQLMQRNIAMATSSSDFVSYCAVSHQHQGQSLSLQTASSPGLALCRVLHPQQESFNATAPASLAGAALQSNGQDTDGNPNGRPSHLEINNSTSLATGAGNHEQSQTQEQQQRDVSHRSSNLSSTVSSIIAAPGPATEIPSQPRSGTASVPQRRQLPQAKSNSGDTSSLGTCRVCYDNLINTMLLPCGHVALCAQCAMRCNNCPICRSTIRGTVRVLLA